MSRDPLPIDGRLEEIGSALVPGSTVLLQAPPGAGKTTQVPLTLLERFGAEGSILMLEPRRLAARAAAERLAAGLGEPLGQRVGYSVRLESRRSASTVLEVLTAGIFLRRLQKDPSLESVACVIFDEFHERGADAELALALVRQARALLRPELRLLVMSATLDLEPLASQLDEAQVISSPGRSHPVDCHHQVPRQGESLERQVLRGLEEHWLDAGGNGETVLVFLPGQREIRAVQRAVEASSWGGQLECCPLHGELSLAAQRRAIAPAAGDAGKLVLATSIAESSLTIEGVSLVIDSGLSRRNRFDPASAMDGLVTVPASLASGEQRLGRAGRLGPGRCLRLWSPGEQHRRPAFDNPEILEVDPLPIALELALWGTEAGEELPWLQPPPPAPLREARRFLRSVNAIDGSGRITAHGRAMAQLGVHPRLAHMLLLAQSRGWLELGCAVAVLVSERDPLIGKEVGCDLMRRLDWLRRGEPVSPNHRERKSQPDPRSIQIRRLVDQLRRQLNQIGPNAAKARPLPTPASETDEAIVSRLISWAFPDRISLARGERSGRFLMRNGRGAALSMDDPLAGAEALAIARIDGHGQDGRVWLAVALDPAVLEELVITDATSHRQVRWDRASERVRGECILQLDCLVLERSAWPEPDPASLRAAMVEGVRQMGLECLPWDQRSRQLQHRLSLAHRFLGEPWPDRRPECLESGLESWLTPYLNGIRSRQDLRRLDLETILWGDLSWEQRADLERWLPESLQVPSGRRIPIDYRSGSPVLAVKLQEMFGCACTPMLLRGNLPITVELLSPAGRPAAITTDLAGFWERGYGAVRRELRGRYPKHPWPEDPHQAVATQLTKAALGRLGTRAEGQAQPNRPSR